MPPADKQFLERARAAYQKDGEVEFDDDAKVSRTKCGDLGYSPNGAYVQAWVWVELPEEEEKDCPSLEAPGHSISCRCDLTKGHTTKQHVCSQHAHWWN